MIYDVIDLTKKLIACPSVTPKDAGAQIYLAEQLSALGFECHHLQFGEVPNLFARLGTGGLHLCYGGHTDVVPPGDEAAWTYGAFTPHIENGILYGRGASDMKGSVAAFVAAVSAYLNKNNLKGSISLLITGDEEGPATNGTVKVLEWMQENGHMPDVALVGEPTNPDHLGQEIKIGRRGSLTGYLSASGKQGHVAYPHIADNPLPKLVKALSRLASYEFDQGSDFFPATNLEITTIDVGNKASNVIPAHGKAIFNIRYNDHWTGESLEAKIREIIGESCALEVEHGAHCFMTKPGHWSETVQKSVADITGKTPAYTTGGGTSDARFFASHCPVVEFGGINKTIHQVDENASVQDLQDLTKIFARMLEHFFKK